MRFNYSQWAKDHPLSLGKVRELYSREARRGFIELALEALADDGGFWRDCGNGAEQWVVPK